MIASEFMGFRLAKLWILRTSELSTVRICHQGSFRTHLVVRSVYATDTVLSLLVSSTAYVECDGQDYSLFQQCFVIPILLLIPLIPCQLFYNRNLGETPLVS